MLYKKRMAASFAHHYYHYFTLILIVLFLFLLPDLYSPTTPTIAAAGFILLPRSTMRAIIFLVRPALSAPLCCGIFLAGLPLLSPA